MSTNVTLSLPDEIYQRAQRLARVTGRDLPAILADTLAMALSLLGPGTTSSVPLAEASDDEVLALTELQMDPAEDQQLSAMLDRQQAGTLRAEERVELMALMEAYQDGLLRKAQALREAVKRGLRAPLTP
ncbi:MAG: hypothetical protein U0359_10045 [Byssovorax sp.]